MSVCREAWAQKIALSAEEIKRTVHEYFSDDEGAKDVSVDQIANIILRQGPKAIDSVRPGLAQKLWSGWGMFPRTHSPAQKEAYWELTRYVGRLHPRFKWWDILQTVPKDILKMEFDRREKERRRDSVYWIISLLLNTPPSVDFSEIHSIYREPRIRVRIEADGEETQYEDDISSVGYSFPQALDARPRVSQNGPFLVVRSAEEPDAKIEVIALYPPYQIDGEWVSYKGREAFAIGAKWLKQYLEGDF